MDSEIIINHIESLDEEKRKRVLEKLYERFFASEEAPELKNLNHRLNELADQVEKNVDSIKWIQEKMILSAFEQFGQKYEERECNESKSTEARLDKKAALPIYNEWTKILHLIESEITEPAYSTWIKPIHHEDVALQDHLIVIPCSNGFQRDWLESQYLKIIKETASNVLEKEIEILFIFEEKCNV